MPPTLPVAHIGNPSQPWVSLSSGPQTSTPHSTPGGRSQSISVGLHAEAHCILALHGPQHTMPITETDLQRKPLRDSLKTTQNLHLSHKTVFCPYYLISKRIIRTENITANVSCTLDTMPTTEIHK